MCIVPMDHGTTLGPIHGIDDYFKTIRLINKAGPNAIVLHKGLLIRVSQDEELACGNYIMHLSVSTVLSKDPQYKVLVSSVEEAVKLGALGVSIHINFGVDAEADMIKDLGTVSKTCLEWGMPLLAMVYSFKEDNNLDHMIHAARIAEELGADIVKIAYPGTQQKTKEIIDKIIFQ